VQLIVTAVLAPAGLGVAVQFGSGGELLPLTFIGTVPLLLIPVGLVVVTVGLLPNALPVPVQVAVPAAANVLGVQVAPGMLMLDPG
jgi:hypothetical protein